MSTSSHRSIRKVEFSRRSFLEQNALGFPAVALGMAAVDGPHLGNLAYGSGKVTHWPTTEDNS